MWIAPYWRGSVDANNAMAAIDSALWDILGKRCGVPVYTLLGGKVRTGLRMLGDIQAQLSGCLMGRDLLEALVAKYTLAAFRGSVALMWDRSEAAARAAIRAFPDGRYEVSTFLDDDGVDLGKRMPLDIALVVAGDEMTVDLSGVARQVRG